MNDKLQQYEAHEDTINALIDDITLAIALNKQKVRSAPSHAALFVKEIQMAKDALIEALEYLTSDTY